MCCNNLAQNVKSVAKILHKMMQILQQSCTTCQKLSKNHAQNGANNPLKNAATSAKIMNKLA